jgi:glycogen debranching enzyme
MVPDNALGLAGDDHRDAGGAYHVDMSLFFLWSDPSGLEGQLRRDQRCRGRLAEPPIALCEVQGYLYAALLGRAELAEAFGDPAAATCLRDRADTLRGKFLEAFWLPEKGWYAIALDGGKRRVDALSSNVGHCLWTGIATDEHAAEIIERLSGEQMDSGFGLRTLATTMGAYNPMSYHNGSVWPHDTAIAVAGLMRYRHVPGAMRLAERLANGLLDAADAFDGRLPELFCGFPRSRFSRPVPYPTACAPQGWASAALLLLVRSFLGFSPRSASSMRGSDGASPGCDLNT